MANKESNRYVYKHNPIQEAIFELRSSVDNWDFALPGRFYERVKKRFPVKIDMQSITIFVGPGGTSQPTPVQAPLMQVWNRKKTQLLQIGPGIVTANCLKYTTWNDFRPAITDAIECYLELAEPSLITKLSTRYINRFVFPEPEIELEKFFKFGLDIPEPIRKLSGFQITLFNQEELDNGSQQHTRTTFFSAPPEGQTAPDRSALILDIDSYLVGTIQASPAKLLETTDLFHDSIENIFESFLTNELRTRLGAQER